MKVARRVSVETAREFWSHQSQLVPGITPDMLPYEGVDYWASGPICGAFRLGPWPGVFMADYGVKPEGWGHLQEPALAVLNGFWSAKKPQLICGWTDSNNRAALAFARRIGFQVTGEMTLENGRCITAQEWRP